MKKLILTLAAFSTLTFAGFAQNDRSSQPTRAQLSPEQRAEKQTEKAASHLSLSDAQKSTFKKLTIERISQNKPLRQKMRASTNKDEKAALQNQIKANNEKFFASVNSMLTPDQQTKWADQRKKMEAKQKGGPDQND